jgi:hypothetical protein
VLLHSNSRLPTRYSWRTHNFLAYRLFASLPTDCCPLSESSRQKMPPHRVPVSSWPCWLILPLGSLVLVPTHSISDEEGGPRTDVPKFPPSKSRNFAYQSTQSTGTGPKIIAKFQIRPWTKYWRLIGYIPYFKFFSPLFRDICVLFRGPRWPSPWSDGIL